MVVSFIMMTIYPTMIAPLFNKYIKLEAGPLYEAIERLAERVEFPLTEVLWLIGLFILWLMSHYLLCYLFTDIFRGWLTPECPF